MKNFQWYIIFYFKSHSPLLCGVVFVLNNLCLQRIGGEIKSFSTDSWVARKLSKRMDKYMLYLLTVGKKALADGGITHDKMDELNKEKCGILIGSVGWHTGKSFTQI